MTFGKWLGFVTLIVSLYILWKIHQLVLLVLTAVILANAMSMLVTTLQKRLSLKRGIAVLLSTILVISGLVGLFWIIVPSFTDQFQQLALQVIQSLERLNIWLLKLEERLDPRFIEALPNLNELIAQLRPLINQIFGQGWGLFFNTIGGLLNVLLVLVLTLMLLANPTPYRQGFIRLFPSFYRRRVDEILHLCDEDLQGWLLGVLFNMSAIGILSFSGLLLLGIPLAFSQAILAAVLTLVPNIGPVLSVIPPMAISFLEEPWKPIAVLILYFGIQQVESNLLTPFVMARQVALLPAITLLAQVFFATTFGFLGLFLALPLTVIGQVWVKEVLIKDILDEWQSNKKLKMQPIPDNLSSEALETSPKLESEVNKNDAFLPSDESEHLSSPSPQEESSDSEQWE
ncbi:AI-2E family transporter [Lusitaniella coriacea LEGE 07157]|uniref:AI-2E family transporter n=1 Tax=Lusitaniella coriacea LEGE 07157 TaxID=945747 RepID=A0A8J7DYM5_9CYAN|nr:AI-2E family transporter [Lusitaniella coriacea]MBE9117668.1 AI-2E family transporter [Lusitaniella coriacea LEGE 07157]